MFEIHQGSVLRVLPTLPAESFHCCITSPPYWGLRDYGVDGQIGGEQTPDMYVEKLVRVFREVYRVLRGDGTLWLNLGDSYAQDKKWGGTTGGKHAKGLHGTTGIGRNRTNTGLTGKNLVGIPWKVAFALQADGWLLRQDIIWHKPNPMPEPVRDRCTKAHEYLFLLSKSARYFFDQDAIKEDATGRPPGNKRPTKSGRKYGDGDEHHRTAANLHKIKAKDKRNKRSVWSVTVKPYPEAHFATFPPDLIEPCVLAGCPEGGTVLDPFLGSGTTAQVCEWNGRNCVGIELNQAYIGLAEKRARTPRAEKRRPKNGTPQLTMFDHAK